MPKDLTFDVQIALISLLVYNSPLGRSRLRWEHNIKLDPQDVGWEHGLDRSDSEQGQMTDSCKQGNENLGSIK